MFISKMNDNSSVGKASFVSFHFVNVKENWAYLPETHSSPGAIITTVFKLS